MTDDFDGTELKPGQGQTVSFSFQGDRYEMELSDKNFKRFAAEIEVWASKAHRPAAAAPTGRGRARSTPKKAASHDNTAIRDWARQNGHSLSQRGRISSAIVAAYEAAST